MNNKQNKEDIIQRLKQHYGFTTNAELANKLGVAPNTISGWIKRNSIDFDLVLSKCEDMDLNWLISGKTMTHEDYLDASTKQVPPQTITFPQFSPLQLIKEKNAEMVINNHFHQSHNLEEYSLYEIQENLDLINTAIENCMLSELMGPIYQQYKIDRDFSSLEKKFIEAYNINKELYLILAPYEHMINELRNKITNFLVKYNIDDI